MLDRYTTGLWPRGEGLFKIYITLAVGVDPRWITSPAIILIRSSMFASPISMAEEKEIKLPDNIIKGLFFLLMLAGILLLVIWTAVALIPQGIFFDLGLYSISSVMILGGLTGWLLYSHREKLQSS